ncbi:HAD family phosphatase [Limosilactobacillus fermentum]|nr:HAD family phosphatase [Limosilactobacillus fermentum]
MKPMKKMIALDLDNTLLNDQKEISPANTKILRRLHEQGIKVVLCTGRPINAIWHLIEQLDLTRPDDFTITFNGGLVINNQSRKALYQNGLSKEDLVPVHDFMAARRLPMDVLDFEQIYEIDPDHRSLYRQTVKNIRFEDTTFEQLAAEDHVYAKNVMAIPAEEMPAVKSEVLATDRITKRVQVVQSQPHILEFLPQGSDKAVGIKHLLNHFGLDFADLMAFGDADNDAGMLKAAGDGVVMANGLPAVKAIADHETASNEEDGVARYLTKTFATIL